MKAVSVSLKSANAFVEALHRHHKKVQGHKFSIGCVVDEKLVGVVIVGRPVSRILDDGKTVEVTRLCSDGTANVCSFLYSAARRAAKELGYAKAITYILDSETGVSLKASGWKKVADIKGHSWNCASRPRIDKAPTCDKTRWEIVLNAA